ncbi:MAG: hypothetical protein HGB20_01345 [Chlorobiaceae bacterium]|nr:hypothetical protein [Chlorobiaceae bacterium]
MPLRTIAALILLPVIIAAAAWICFPCYAQFILDRALQGTPISVKISGIGHPDFSGVRFRSLEAVFTSPPSPCSKGKIIYDIKLNNGRLFLDLKQFTENEGLPSPQKKHSDIAALLSVTSDTLHLRSNPPLFTFIDSNPLISILFGASRLNDHFSFNPVSATYSIRDAAIRRDDVILTGVNCNVRLLASEKWQLPKERLSIEKIYSEGKLLPLGGFNALFTTIPDPIKPCTITLDDCSVELYHWKATAGRVEYCLKNNSARFTLRLDDIPLDKLTGNGTGKNSFPTASGKIKGLIPVEFSDSVAQIRNARVIAEKGSRVSWLTGQGKPWITVDLADEIRDSGLIENLSATIVLKHRKQGNSGIELRDLSASVFGGKIASVPMQLAPSEGKALLTLKLNNIDLLDRIHLRGEYKGSLRGKISGTMPIGFDKNGFSIANARLRSPGGGTVSVALPRQREQSLKDRIIAAGGMNADYIFSEPDIVFSRDTIGRTIVRFALKKLQRITPSGGIELLDPRGKLSLLFDRENPDMVSLSDFSAQLLDGNIRIDKADYDMRKKVTETTLFLNGIPLQKLLELQGVKKIYATGTMKGSVPLRIKSDRFEIMNGGLNAEQSGQIIFSSTPEERATATQGLRTTYEALSNFFYAQLLSSISMAPDGKSVITVKLRGNNPDFQGGRLVEMNLNIEQNLLDLFRSLSITSGIEQIISEKAMRMKKRKTDHISP